MVTPQGTGPVLLPSRASTEGLKSVRKRLPTKADCLEQGQRRGPGREVLLEGQDVGVYLPDMAMSIGQHLLARRAVQHFFGKAAVAARQHKLEPGDQDVRADPGQQVALPDGVGA